MLAETTEATGIAQMARTHAAWTMSCGPLARGAVMHAILEALRESFTLYLAAGILFSAASVWAVIRAGQVSEAGKKSNKPE
jgi:hypothetical protein